jgi:hypothetical protein
MRLDESLPTSAERGAASRSFPPTRDDRRSRCLDWGARRADSRPRRDNCRNRCTFSTSTHDESVSRRAPRPRSSLRPPRSSWLGRLSECQLPLWAGRECLSAGDGVDCGHDEPLSAHLGRQSAWLERQSAPLGRRLPRLGGNDRLAEPLSPLSGGLSGRREGRSEFVVKKPRQSASREAERAARSSCREALSSCRKRRSPGLEVRSARFARR